MPMAVAEQQFLLDTGAWRAVRRRRRLERVALPLIIAGAVLAVVLLLVGGTFAYRLVADRGPTAPAEPKAVAAPEPAATPIAVWNGLGADGVAAEAARQLMLADYPITAVGDAPDHNFEKTYVMYQVDDPAGIPAAKRLIRQLRLEGAVPTPMEGVGADRIGGARLLLIVADPLKH